MIPVLLILGAGAALEIKRLTQRAGSNDQARADKERHLKDLLQALRKELEKEREERAAESAKREELAQQAAELAAERYDLQTAKGELDCQVEALRGRAEALALSAESLLQDKGAALRQVEKLQAEAENGQKQAAEAAAQLRRDVANALEAFTSGDLDASGFLEELSSLGVHVDCTADALTLTPASGTTGVPSAAPISGSWSQSMRLVCGSSERMAQLITAGSLLQEGQPSARALPPIGEAAYEAGTTPRLGMANAVSAANTLAALTPRLFANANNLPKEAQPQQHAPAAMMVENHAKGQELAKPQPGPYTVEASSMLFTRPAKAGPSKKPPVVPRLGLNVDLGSSGAGPASHRTALTAIDFAAEDDCRDMSTLIVRT